MVTSVWVIWARGEPYQSDDMACGYFQSEQAARDALESYWNAHDPGYFGGRESFDAGYYVTGETVLDSGTKWAPWK